VHRNGQKKQEAQTMETKKITIDKELTDNEIQHAEYNGFEFAGQTRGRVCFRTEFSNKAIRIYWKSLLSSINNEKI
jgi:Icc-related predicted phosphoesterase